MDRRFDVIVFERSTRKVTGIPGKNLRRHGAYQSAESIEDLMFTRLDIVNFDALTVPTGRYKVGDVVEETQP